MFKFLFGKKAEEAVVVETQRETFERLINELNNALDVLDAKPTITVNPETGHVGLVLPEHLPDEALSLPAPAPEEKPVEVTSDEVKSTDAGAAEPDTVIEDEPAKEPIKEEKAA
ncbi:hypothetical protein [Cognatishimia sp. MH4019]|uniref:hypothetical protein n=1 Tax=Cognatishimia sp. MH4019 TaxID=2854030 RepID=UPI001CD49C63|nr:hypothetical protein [Cognatishimia sp. MH4019]